MFNFIRTVLAGVAIGLLIAPEKGSETRRKISKLFTDLTDDAKDVVNRTENDVKHKANEAIKKIENETN